MNDYIAEITLDLNCEKNCQTVYLTEFDKGKKLHLTVTADGAPYSLTGCDVVMKGVGADGSRIAVDCRIESDGTATAVTDDTTFPVKGIAAARFVISDDTRTYYTQKFLLYVDDALDSDIEADERYSILDRLIRQIHMIDEHGGILVDDEMDAQSNHPVENRVIVQALKQYCAANSTDQMPSYSNCDRNTLYLNAKIGNESGIILPLRGKDIQLFIGEQGSIKVRYYAGGNDYLSWSNALAEPASNKQSAISASNRASNVLFPTIRAVTNYVAENYCAVNTGAIDVSDPADAAALADGTLYTNVTRNSEGGIAFKAHGENRYWFMNESGVLFYTYRAAGSYYIPWTSVLLTLRDVESAINPAAPAPAKIPSEGAVTAYAEKLANKITRFPVQPTNDQYPSAKLVFDELTGKSEDIDTLDAKVENYYTNLDNRVNQKLDDAEGSVDEENLGNALAAKINTSADGLSGLLAYTGCSDSDILGLQIDLENSRFTRLAGAANLSAGADFNAFPMYGGRRRVVVDSSGAIQTAMDPDDITAGDTDYDVMVYQPKFYYRMVPIKLEKQTNGLGYHIRKANYYITATPHAGFKVHPLFLDAGGNEVDYVLLSAFEASYLDGSRYFNDDTDTEASISGTAVLKSMPGVKPISGKYKSMTKANMEMLAQRKSANWHLDTIQSVSANQLLMMVEFGVLNMQGQDGLGFGNTNKTGIPESDNGADPTGTAQPDASTGTTAYSAASAPVCYRWMENPYGNIWKHVNGLNLWGNGTIGGGQAYITDNYSFSETAHGSNYKPAGFSLPNTSSYVSAFGYGSEKYDWLLFPSECSGGTALPVGDYSFSNANLNGLRIAFIGGRWVNGDSGNFAGLFLLNSNYGAGRALSFTGGRLLYVPSATV